MNDEERGGLGVENCVVVVQVVSSVGLFRESRSFVH